MIHNEINKKIKDLETITKTKRFMMDSQDLIVH